MSLAGFVVGSMVPAFLTTHGRLIWIHSISCSGYVREYHGYCKKLAPVIVIERGGWNDAWGVWEGMFDWGVGKGWGEEGILRRKGRALDGQGCRCMDVVVAAGDLADTVSGFTAYWRWASSKKTNPECFRWRNVLRFILVIVPMASRTYAVSRGAHVTSVGVACHMESCVKWSLIG